MNAERRVNFGCEATIRIRFSDELSAHELDEKLKMQVRNILIDLAEYLDTDIVKYTEHHFPGHGTTACAILSSSHAIIHTWPESRCAVISVYCCTRESVKLIKKMTVLGIMDSMLKYGFKNTKIWHKYNVVAIPLDM